MYRSKVKLTTRELKLALKQGTILLEEFYPSKVLKRLVTPSSPDDATMPILKSNESSIIEDIGGSLTRHNILNKVLLANNSVKRISMLKDLVFETEEAWWDSKGLQLG